MHHLQVEGVFVRARCPLPHTSTLHGHAQNNTILIHFYARQVFFIKFMCSTREIQSALYQHTSPIKQMPAGSGSEQKSQPAERRLTGRADANTVDL